MVHSIAFFLRKKKEEAAYYLFVGVCMTVYLVTRKAFYHYTMITVPFLPAIAAVCTDVPWAFVQRNKGKLRMVLAAFIINIHFALAVPYSSFIFCLSPSFTAACAS